MATVLRLSPVKARRRNAPYINFPSPLSNAHPESYQDLWPHVVGTAGGWGTRHLYDQAPFAMWDAHSRDFRLLQDTDLKWLKQNFGALAVGQFGPFLVIETETPPSPLLLTVGGMPVMFVPERTVPGEFLYDPFRVKNNTAYASPRVADPINSFKIPYWEDPTEEQMDLIAYTLGQVASIKRITYMWQFTIVELEMDGRTYMPRSLPAVVAGCATLYHHSSSPYWGLTTQRRRWTVPSVDQDVQDVTNYLIVGNKELRPGVRLSSSWTDIDNRPQQSTATTAGVFLRNRDQVRMTCSLHGWQNSNEVFHPQPSGKLIGTVRERYDAQDMALVELNPAIQFTNHRYFEANIPRRLLTRAECGRMRGVWYTADGMSTGCISLVKSGTVYEFPPRPLGHARIPFATWREEGAVYSNLYTVMGATGGDSTVADGLCGAPIVDHSGGSNGVAGFFPNV
ncbi:hypothetical protein MMC24_005360 [Lignoscripta atroalba]|nr:hypothetical protein [Lignoscripta atroalba]